MVEGPSSKVKYTVPFGDLGSESCSGAATISSAVSLSEDSTVLSDCVSLEIVSLVVCSELSMIVVSEFESISVRSLVDGKVWSFSVVGGS